MKEHMGHPTLTLHIDQRGKFIDVRQFHHRADGKIGYHLFPYAEDEQGRWRENLGIGFDHTGMNFISKPEWKMILKHWTQLAFNNPSSAEFIDYVSRWVITTLEHVDEIAIEGNL
ncbi:hypothetical protein FHS14_001428 [Paenibacillus baekrokdamisoli]|nr:hypothetical protein [Paenibacillus baekrokdamisoli]MBB3068452.1 hypothetical protein [Paenibacillus baekrokdamisoli]